MINGICVRVQEDHVWVSEFFVVPQKMLESLQSGIEVPFTRQWCQLWFSAPSKLNEHIRKDGSMRNTMERKMDHALRVAVEHPFVPRWIPRDCVFGHNSRPPF